jgi:hypothetical protein
MKTLLRRLGLVFTILALCLPVGLMVVYLLYPLWRWLEATYGIESVGHSGPAPWCFAVVYFGLVAAATIALWIGGRKRARNPA